MMAGEHCIRGLSNADIRTLPRGKRFHGRNMRLIMPFVRSQGEGVLRMNSCITATNASYPCEEPGHKKDERNRRDEMLVAIEEFLHSPVFLFPGVVIVSKKLWRNREGYFQSIIEISCVDHALYGF
jgi:hypothetical protein